MARSTRSRRRSAVSTRSPQTVPEGGSSTEGKPSRLDADPRGIHDPISDRKESPSREKEPASDSHGSENEASSHASRIQRRIQNFGWEVVYEETGHRLTREELPDADGYLYTKEYFRREPLYTKDGPGYEFVVEHATMIFVPKI